MPSAILRIAVWQALSRSVVAAALLLTAIGLHAQETLLTGNGAVAGRVFCADTQKPARFAGVRLTPASTAIGMMGGSFAGAGSTSGDGSFFINNVRPGEYYVSAQMPGYIDPLRSFSPRGSMRPSNDVPDALKPMLTRVTVSANQTTTVQVTAFRGALLAGAVLYDDGTPAAGIPVSAERVDNSTQNDGEAPAPVNMRDLAFSSTTDRGEFRLGGLPDGVYVIMARPRSWGPNGPGTLPVYYGNTLRKSEARRLELRAGEERGGLELQIPVTTLKQVSGVVQSSKDGHGLARVMVSLTLTGEAGDALTAVSAADGSFHFLSVPNGKFTLRVNGASDSSGARGLSGDSSESVTIYGAQEKNIEINGMDIDNLVLSLPVTSGSHSLNNADQ
jgi:hypothetical protein